MKRAVFFALLVGCTVACAHVKPVVAPVVDKCKPTSDDIEAAFTDLESDGWQAALETLAVKKGLCLVNAAVDDIVKTLSPPPGATAQALVAANETDILARGVAWLAGHP